MSVSKLRKPAVFLAGLMVIVIMMTGITAFGSETGTALSIIDSIPAGSWQAVKSFPDQAGHIDNSLAMNNMYSFYGFSGQGELYLETGRDVVSFDLFVNNHAVNTAGLTGGRYSLDIADIALKNVFGILIRMFHLL